MAKTARNKAFITRLAYQTARSAWRFMKERCLSCPRHQEPPCPFDPGGRIQEDTPRETEERKRDLLVVEFTRYVLPKVERFLSSRSVRFPPDSEGLLGLGFTLGVSLARMVEVCETCPTQCLRYPDEVCYMFDYPRSGR